MSSVGKGATAYDPGRSGLQDPEKQVSRVHATQFTGLCCRKHAGQTKKAPSCSQHRKRQRCSSLCVDKWRLLNSRGQNSKLWRRARCWLVVSFPSLCFLCERLSLSLLTINATDYRTHFIRNTNAPVFLLGKAASSVCCLPAQPLVDAKPI